MRALAAVALAAAAAGSLAAGCGQDAGGSGSTSSIVGPAGKRTPPINSLEIDPDGEGFYLTTNMGFYRIENGEATKIDSQVKTPDGPSAVGTFLTVAAGDDGELIASGHPDDKGNVAPFLGLLRSEDGGENWEVVSRYSLSDIHSFHELDGTLYGYDAVLPALLVSTDGGKTFEERGAPQGLAIDFVVDPGDPEQMLATTETQIFHSTDGGRNWTAELGTDKSRLAWPEEASLYRADADGMVYVSDNGGSTWEVRGRVDGEPWKLVAVGPDELYTALADGTIEHSTDAGESWEAVFTPS
jgi:photosystem II stability/assembly factor-like uncharacterized protein